MAKTKYKREKEINFDVKNFSGDFIVMYSGGKDSTAALLYVLNYIRNYNKKNKVRVLFADTQIEHPFTYEYIDYVEKKLNIQIEHINNDGFLDVCLNKKMFPRPKTRFCTKDIKVRPFREWIYNNYVSQGKKTGKDFVVVQGIRAEESDRRAAVYAEFNVKTYKVNYKPFSVIYWHPILDWTTQQVFDYIQQNGLKQNKVYTHLKLNRASCFPCIMSNKAELQYIANDEQALKRVVEMEKALFYSRKNAKDAYTTFFMDYNKQRYITEKMLEMDEVREDEEFYEAVLLYKMTEEKKKEYAAELSKGRREQRKMLTRLKRAGSPLYDELKKYYELSKNKKKTEGAAEAATESIAKGGENGNFK